MTQSQHKAVRVLRGTQAKPESHVGKVVSGARKDASALASRKRRDARFPPVGVADRVKGWHHQGR